MSTEKTSNAVAVSLLPKREQAMDMRPQAATARVPEDPLPARLRLPGEIGRLVAAAKGEAREAVTLLATATRVAAHDLSVKPPPASDEGLRTSAIIKAKKGRAPTLRDARTAAEERSSHVAQPEAGEQQPNRPTTASKSAMITKRDRKTVQRLREQQQQVAKLMQGEQTEAA